MKQIINSNSYPDFPNTEIEYHKPVELFIDSFNGFNPNKKSFKIVYAKEVDDQILDFELVNNYPLELYEKALQKLHSKEVKIEMVSLFNNLEA